MSILVNSDIINEGFYPFTITNQLSQVRIGKYSFEERWQILAKKYLLNSLSLPANYLPTINLLNFLENNKKAPTNLKNYCIVLKNSVDILIHNYTLLELDLKLTSFKNEKFISTSKNVFFEKNVKFYSSNFNTEKGPIYICKNVEIQEGVYLRGPLYIGENSIVKMGATIYGTTIIGNNCIIGGEVKNSIIMNNSNKAHYGYLGDSIIGEWCNLGAGTTNSNIKNNASNIILNLQKAKINAGFKFGILMGNYSKSAINTSFNTGTVVGICSNVFCSGLTPKNIPSFSWGTIGEKYIFEKAIIDINKWKALKNEKLNDKEVKQIKIVYEKI